MTPETHETRHHQPLARRRAGTLLPEGCQATATWESCSPAHHQGGSRRLQGRHTYTHKARLLGLSGSSLKSNLSSLVPGTEVTGGRATAKLSPAWWHRQL